MGPQNNKKFSIYHSTFCTQFRLFEDLIYTAMLATTDALLMGVNEFTMISKAVCWVISSTQGQEAGRLRTVTA